MILIISVCKENFQELEFVKPIEKFVGKNYFVKNYENINENDLEKADKIIISGTSLKDFEYLKKIDSFSWIKSFKKPVLGICAGMQIIGLIFGSKLLENKYIGQLEINFRKEFLGLEGKNKVYFLHNKVSELPRDFISFFEDNFPFVFKHKKREIYGVLFHPEVFNPEIIQNFVEI